MSRMPIRARVIPSGGSVTLSPCRLSAVAASDGSGQGKITDAWGRQFHSPPNGIADWGAGTAPFIAGTVTAQDDTIAYFDFS